MALLQPFFLAMLGEPPADITGRALRARMLRDGVKRVQERKRPKGRSTLEARERETVGGSEQDGDSRWPVLCICDLFRVSSVIWIPLVYVALWCVCVYGVMCVWYGVCMCVQYRVFCGRGHLCARACMSSTQEVETGRSEAQGHPQVHIEFKASLEYRGRPCVK